MKKNPTYWQRLSVHPGVPVAFAMTVIGAFAGMGNESMTIAQGSVFGAFVMGLVCWPVVLWTARTQPVADDD